jgi:hypothetical protein
MGLPLFFRNGAAEQTEILRTEHLSADRRIKAAFADAVLKNRLSEFLEAGAERVEKGFPPLAESGPDGAEIESGF